MRPLIEHGLEHVRNGITTLQEVERVLGDPDRKDAAASAVDTAPHVLVVDDDEIVRAFTVQALTEAGMRTSEAADGIEALELIRTNSYALVVLDLDMPRLNGIMTLRRIRSNLASAALPVVILTANRDAELAVMEDGADDYLSKPLEPARLVARVRALLRRRGAA